MFINPIELLDIAEADASVIKKATRKKLLEFDLSDDGMLDLGNEKITKSDFLRVTGQLDNNDTTEFYLFLKNTPKLNAFLKSGNPAFFSNFRYESIYSDADFINFISPYYAAQYDKILHSAYVKNDFTLLQSVIANPLLVNSKDIGKSYKKVSALLNTFCDELQFISNQIDEETSYYEEQNVEELQPFLEDKIKLTLLNSLPNYFQSQKNEIAQKIRNISVSVFNVINNAEESVSILSYALEINSDGLTKHNLEKDYKQIYEIHENRKEAQLYSEDLEEYAGVLLKIIVIIKQLKEGQISPSSINSKINSLISLSKLNSFPNLFDEIRGQIALAIRGLSVQVWNEYEDIDSAIKLIETAKKIKLKQETQNEINEAYGELSRLRNRHGEQVIQVLEGINSAISEVNLSYNRSLNKSKIAEVLNNLFSVDSIKPLKNIGISTKRKIINELKPILLILPTNSVNKLVEKIKPVFERNSDLLSELELMKKKQIPAFSFNSHSSNTSADSNGESNWFWWIVGIAILLLISQCD